MRRTIVAVAGVAALLGLSSPAAAEPFKNKEEAARAGDPAGDGPGRKAPTHGLYKGHLLAFDEIKAKRHGAPLHCVTDDADTTRCFDSATAAYGVAPAAQSSRSSARAAQSCGYTHQVHYKWGSWNNDSYGFQGRTYWQDLPGYMNDDTSSYRMGDRAGHMAEHTQGNGYWYPGDTSRCYDGSITYGPFPHWDNRISSGWRSLN